MLRYTVLLALALIASVASVPAEHKLVKRMIRGDPAKIKDFPYHAYVGNKVFICNGAIIAKKYVLTAAHCVRKPKEDLYVLVGHANRLGSDFAGADKHSIDKIYRHEYFAVDDEEHRSIDDIAVVKVSTPFVYDKHQQPIKLAKAGYKPEVNAVGRSAGWGKIEHGSFFPTHLYKLDFKVVDREACNAAYTSWGGLLDGQFCAATEDPTRKYFCHGDSGSPLVVDNTVIGISIYGGGCELEGTPGVYTDVGYFRDWIDEHVEYDEEEEEEVKTASKGDDFWENSLKKFVSQDKDCELDEFDLEMWQTFAPGRKMTKEERAELCLLKGNSGENTFESDNNV